jgi:hypothetical protein
VSAAVAAPAAAAEAASVAAVAAAPAAEAALSLAEAAVAAASAAVGSGHLFLLAAGGKGSGGDQRGEQERLGHRVVLNRW